MKNNVSVLTVLIAVAGLAGCMDAAESEVEQQTGGGCGLLCQNSPEVAHYGLWEANLHGQPNSNSITISGGANAEITKGGLKYVLSVKDSRIMGLSKVNGTLSGQGLVGAQIQLFQGTQQYYSIRIDGVRPISFAVGAPDLLEAYVMTWISPLTGQPANKQFCNAVLDGTEYEKVFDLLGMRPNETVVFAGDRIDPAMMTTSPVADFNWFNFGCAGHTLAKAHLTRNTISSQPVPSWEGRQATLKMYSPCTASLARCSPSQESRWSGSAGSRRRTGHLRTPSRRAGTSTAPPASASRGSSAPPTRWHR